MTYRQCKKCLNTFPLASENFKPSHIRGVTYYRHTCRTCCHLENNLKQGKPADLPKSRVKTGPKTHEVTPYFDDVAPLPNWLNP